ncbi:MAG: M48 family metallopeptidase [Candidatus Kariarchaeaceae archaeon]|jgi:STE24 endopeptidase
MSDDKPYLTLQQVTESQTDKAKSYHAKTLKMYIFSEIFFPVYYILIVLLKIPATFADLSPSGDDYSLTTVGVVVGLLILIQFLISLPIGWINERIEREYEFSTKTWKKWAKDQLKQLIISLVLFSIFIEAIYLGIDQSSDEWWIVATAIAIVFTALVLMASPYLISLFTKLVTFPAGETREKVENLAKDMGIKYKDIYLWKLSQQTKKANAAVMGFGKSIRIVLGDTLVDEFRDDEIEVVMAHEIGHYLHKDIYRFLVYYSGLFFIFFYIIETGFQEAINQFDYTSRSDPASIGYILAALLILMNIFGILSNWYSRRREKAADILAIKKFANLEIYESAFSRLSQMNLPNPDPSRLEVIFRYSHPPIRERVRYATEYLQR